MLLDSCHEALYALECAARKLDVKRVKSPKSGKLLDESIVRKSYEEFEAELEAMCNRVVAGRGMLPELVKTLYSAIGMKDLRLQTPEIKKVASGALRPESTMYACMGCGYNCEEDLRAINFFGKKAPPSAFGSSLASFEQYMYLDGDYNGYKQQYNTVLQDAKRDSKYMTCESTGVSQRFNKQDGGIWALGPCCYHRANLVFFLRALPPRLAFRADRACVEREKRGEPCFDDQLYSSTQEDAKRILKILRRASETSVKALDGSAISWPNAFDGDDKAFWDAVHEMQNVRFEPGTNEAVFKSDDLKERGRLAHNPKLGWARSEPENPTMRQCATSGPSAKRPAREDDVHAGSSSSSSKTPRLGGVGLIERMKVVENQLCTGSTVLADQIAAANRILGITPSEYSSFPEQVSAIEEVLGTGIGA